MAFVSAYGRGSALSGTKIMIICEWALLDELFFRARAEKRVGEGLLPVVAHSSGFMRQSRARGNGP